MLRIEKTTYKIAKQACLDWHYSKTCPQGGMFFGIYEHDVFIGVVVFSSGSRKQHMMFSDYLERQNIMELARVALSAHQTFTSQIVMQAIRQLVIHKPDVSLIVSFSDLLQEHEGKIYQAMNFYYTGLTPVRTRWLQLPSGETLHRRTANAKYGTSSYIKLNAIPLYDKGKHKYILPLTKKLKRQLKHMAQPYP